jgi:hypothetical protein
VEMVMEDDLENPKSSIKLTPICGFRSTTPAHSEFQNRTGFKNKNKWQLVKPQIAEVSQIRMHEVPRHFGPVPLQEFSIQNRSKSSNVEEPESRTPEILNDKIH